MLAATPSRTDHHHDHHGGRASVKQVTSQRLNAAVFVAIALIGGGNPVGVAIVVDELAPIWAAAFRFLAAGAIFAVAMLVLRVPMPRGRALIGRASCRERV